ncbi:MAG: hypothetical protein ACTSXC_01810 [Candidatus Freyarchaeota archaeon]
MLEENIAIIVKGFSHTLKFLRENSPGMRILLRRVSDELDVYEDDELARIIVRNPGRFYSALFSIFGSWFVTNIYVYIIMGTFFKKVNVKVSMLKVSSAIRRRSMEMWCNILREVLEKEADVREG